MLRTSSLPRFQTQRSLATIEREVSDEENVEPTELQDTQAAASQPHMWSAVRAAVLEASKPSGLSVEVRNRLLGLSDPETLADEISPMSKRLLMQHQRPKSTWSMSTPGSPVPPPLNSQQQAAIDAARAYSEMGLGDAAVLGALSNLGSTNSPDGRRPRSGFKKKPEPSKASRPLGGLIDPASYRQKPRGQKQSGQKQSGQKPGGRRPAAAGFESGYDRLAARNGW